MVLFRETVAVRNTKRARERSLDFSAELALYLRCERGGAV